MSYFSVLAISCCSLVMAPASTASSYSSSSPLPSGAWKSPEFIFFLRFSISLALRWQLFLFVSIFWTFSPASSSSCLTCFSSCCTRLYKPPYSFTRSSKAFCLTKSSSFLSVSFLTSSVMSLIALRSVLSLSSPRSPPPDTRLASLLWFSSFLSLSWWSSSSARSKKSQGHLSEIFSYGFLLIGTYGSRVYFCESSIVFQPFWVFFLDLHSFQEQS